jgi:dsDNA-binding SOS-regulon protein
MNEASTSKAPRKKRPAYKSVEYEGTVSSVTDAYDSLEELASEVREIVDNSPEGLNQTQRIQTLDEAASALEGLSRPDVPEAVAELAIAYSEAHPTDKRREPSRAIRASNYASVLRAASDRVREQLEAHREETDEDQDEWDGMEQFANQLDEDADAVEGCEFPGMMG